MEHILNLTQYPATAEQRKAGVIDMEGTQLQVLKKFLTFGSLPTKQEIQKRAKQIAEFALLYDPQNTGTGIQINLAMIGGAPYFLLSELEKALKQYDITPLYAYSKKGKLVSRLDGSVNKHNVLKHIGFVEA